jgi:hypothetical protein
VPASDLADVLVGDPDPPVLLGARDHHLDQLALALLVLRPPPKLIPRLGQPRGEAVTDALEVGEPQHARASSRPDRPLEAAAREDGGEQLPELALQPGDLPSKLFAGGALAVLADPRSRWEARAGVRWHCRLTAVLLEKLGHVAPFAD